MSKVLKWQDRTPMWSSSWKSATDRPPEKDGRYIVYEPRYGWIGVSSLRHGKWDDTGVTHWMELPEKPQ